MKLSKLIEQAQEALVEHGDIEVMIDFDSRGYKDPFTQVAPQLTYDENGNDEESEGMYFWVCNYDN